MLIAYVRSEIQSHPIQAIHSFTYSFWAFKPVYTEAFQPAYTEALKHAVIYYVLIFYFCYHTQVLKFVTFIISIITMVIIIMVITIMVIIIILIVIMVII